ncbi:hypothetical protein [Kineococcus sp. R86509]|uniref:hypothetical protein n=1 Tax=Kineococcus sp. R86509 TaxID=3093851 RepID=UPI0036D2AFA3
MGNGDEMRHGSVLQPLEWLTAVGVAVGVVMLALAGCSAVAGVGGDPCLPPPLQVSPSTVGAGEQVTVSSGPITCGATYPEGTTYTLMLKAGSDALVQVAEVQVPADGAFSSVVTVPASTPAGEVSLAVVGSLFDQPCQDGEGSCAAYTTLLTVIA